jgi:endonuclease YncB( thermonuclease family)
MSKFSFATASQRLVAFALAVGVIVITSLSTTIAARSYGTRISPEMARGAFLVGIPRVIDGDTIEVLDTRIRLEGIDAPESGQTCNDRHGRAWECGNAATKVLRDILGRHEVQCRHAGLDKYGRMLGTCYVGTLDINAEMVRSGYAWAYVKYSTAYVQQEAAARAVGYGIWQGTATPAWDYRAQKWAAVEQAAPKGCAIKGNVTSNGLIYHMPWSPWYDKVRMGTSAVPDGGKRWFCSEAEAQAAGWRAAYAN